MTGSQRTGQSVRERSSDKGLVGGLVYEMRRRILAWSYPPGARLLEGELSAEFGASRSPVREALRLLEADGFVEKRPNKGYVVKQLDLRSANELYELRMALELYVVETLASREHSREEINRWASVWRERTEPDTGTAEELADSDRRFHEALAEALGNTMLLSRLREINDRIAVFRVVDFENEATVKSARDQHLRIVDAIAAGDAVASREAMRENIERAQSNIRRGLSETVARAYLSADVDSSMEE